MYTDSQFWKVMQDQVGIKDLKNILPFDSILPLGIKKFKKKFNHNKYVPNSIIYKKKKQLEIIQRSITGITRDQ